MALPLTTLRDIEALLTSERISYKGIEIQRVSQILLEISREQAEATKTLRVVPNDIAPKEVAGG